MRVAWIQDNSRPYGGAEMSNKCVVAVGESLGFDIVGITPTNFHVSVLEQADVLVVNNFFQFHPTQVRTVMAVLQRKPYVKYEHDSREIGRVEFAKRLFGDSMLNVFLSPAHLANHRERLGCNGVAMPLAIQTDLFRPVPGIVRDPNRALIIGGWIRGGKISTSIKEFVARHKDLSFVSVGFDLPGALCLPHMKIEDMPALYSSAGWLVHLPDMVCAGERVVFEAALCGCQVVMNDNVGHKSWNRDLIDADALRDWLHQAPFTFWKTVFDNVMKERTA